MTRASDNDFDLTPYIIEGDTVMYIVNYNPGWQLFSNLLPQIPIGRLEVVIITILAKLLKQTFNL